MNWLDEVVEYVNQKGQGLGAPPQYNGEEEEENQTAFGMSPMRTIADLAAKTGQSIDSILQAIKPANVVSNVMSATGLEPTYGETAFGKSSIPTGIRSNRPAKPESAPTVASPPYVLPATTPNAPTPYGVPGMESQMVGEDPNRQFKQGETLEQYKGRLGIDNRGNTSEEIEKAWGKPEEVTDAEGNKTNVMRGGISGLGDTVSNKNMFQREDKEAEAKKDYIKSAEERMAAAKEAAVRVLGYNPDDIDPQREALGNTYRHLQGSYYTPQQYNAVYNYYYKDAMDKKKSGATAVQTVMERVMTDARSQQNLDETKKQEFQRRQEKDKADAEAKKATLAERQKQYTEKAVEQAADHYEKAIDTLNKEYEKKYPMDESWENWQPEDRDEYNKRMQNIRARYENTVKRHGYTAWADTGKAAPQTGGGQQAQSKYVIKSVK